MRPLRSFHHVICVCFQVTHIYYWLRCNISLLVVCCAKQIQLVGFAPITRVAELKIRAFCKYLPKWFANICTIRTWKDVFRSWFVRICFLNIYETLWCDGWRLNAAFWRRMVNNNTVGESWRTKMRTMYTSILLCDVDQCECLCDAVVVRASCRIYMFHRTCVLATRSRTTFQRHPSQQTQKVSRAQRRARRSRLNASRPSDERETIQSRLLFFPTFMFGIWVWSILVPMSFAMRLVMWHKWDAATKCECKLYSLGDTSIWLDVLYTI